MIDHRSTSHVVRIGARETPQHPSPIDLRVPRSTPAQRPRLPEEDAVALASSFRASVLARALSLFLVPLMLVYPLAPVFAEELSPASTPDPVQEEPAPSVSDVPAQDEEVTESTPEESETPPASDATPAPSEGEVGAGESEHADEGEVAGASEDEAANEDSSDTISSDDESTDTEIIDPADPPSDETVPEEDPTEEPDVLPGDTEATSSEDVSTSTESQVGVESDGGTELATTTDETALTASSSDVLLEGGFASSTSQGSSGVGTEAPPSPADAQPTAQVVSAEDPAIVAARVAAERDALKARLLEEVKAEFLSGCVTLERGGYYCLSDDARGIASVPRASAAVSVSASTDGKGTDKEIFLSGPDAAIQLTDNAIEDAFPSKDLSGRSVVWQAEDAGRWQIMYADLSSSTPLVGAVTAGLESNFNPAVEGETVVWQGWADGNWEIFMAERDILPDMIDLGAAARQVGATPGWRVSRITTNGTHDMFPGIAGGMITWQAFDGSAWNVYAYSRATGETVRISAGEGSAERPRFAMLWEERGQDGRVRLMGYDMARGERVDVTEEARASGDGRRAPAMPPSPVSSPDQPALPIGSASTTTPVRPEGDAPPDPLAP